MANNQVTKRKKDKRAEAAAAEAAQPKTAYSSIATRNKAELASASAQAERKQEEARRRREEQADTRVTSTRIKDLPKEDKGEAYSAVRARRRRRIAIMTTFVAIILAIIGLSSIYNSNIFTIEYLSIKGVRHLTASEMTELAAVPEGTTLLRVDTEAIRERLLTDAWVADATVRSVFPNTLEITITEREIGAVVEISNTDASSVRRWAIATDGLWLMPIPDQDSEAGALISETIYEDIENVLTITDVPYGDQPDIGTYCTDEYVNCALSIVNSLSTSLVDMISEVQASNTASTTLVLTNGVEIVFGDDTDVRLKEQICLELLEQHEGNIVYINVSVPDSPTYRTL